MPVVPAGDCAGIGHRPRGAINDAVRASADRCALFVGNRGTGNSIFVDTGLAPADRPARVIGQRADKSTHAHTVNEIGRRDAASILSTVPEQTNPAMWTPKNFPLSTPPGFKLVTLPFLMRWGRQLMMST